MKDLGKRPGLPIWKRFNWYSFYVRKNRVYDVIYSVTAGFLWCTIAYFSMVTVHNWNQGLNRNWKHYCKKEQERSELIDIIRRARDLGHLPPPESKEYEDN
eukprot:GDKH01026399.1.p1 GENE.GDKH01026399.1~~GDKH01026399.1.p1  ORF type:complete len:101 (-),score=2.75 GDKH01026399.1:154-456(-)